MIRVGLPQDLSQRKFDADQAVRAYYNLAPYHKEFSIKPRSAALSQRSRVPSQQKPNILDQK